MATSSVSFVSLEQTRDDDQTTNVVNKPRHRWKLLFIAGLFFIFVAVLCIVFILKKQSNLITDSKTNNQIVIQQHAVSNSLNSKILASKYPNHIVHKENLNGDTRRLQSLALNDEYDYSWIGAIYVSIDGVLQSIPVVFDSGSSNFWITSNRFCVDCSICTNPSYQSVNLCESFNDDSFIAFYPNTNNPVNITTVNNQITTWTVNGQNDPNLPDISIEFINSGAWTGTATDTDCSNDEWIFCIQYEHGKTEGIYTKTQFTTNVYSGTTSTEWISIAYVDTTGVSYHANGVFGLGTDELAIGIDPPLKQMVNAGIVNNNYFFMHFEATNTNSGDGIGYIQFGGTTKTDGEFIGVFDIIEGSDYFEIAMESITVNDEDISISSTTALLDTGTSFIIGPESDVTLIINHIMSVSNVVITLNNDYGLYTVDCDSKDILPDIGIKMIGQEDILYISSDLYIFSKHTVNEQCIVGLKSLNEPHDLNNAWILGDVYLKTIGCVQFDVENRQILYSQQSLGCQVENTQIQ